MVDTPFHDWRRAVRKRLMATAVVCLLWIVVIEARLVHLQVFQYEELTVRARSQQLRTFESAPLRGEIHDRAGRILARTVDADTVYAVPSAIRNPGVVVEALCDALEDCSPDDYQTFVERLKRGGPYANIRRQVSPEQARRVAALHLKGVGFVKESKRFYPNKDLASHLLGYVGVDNTGLSGVEATYDAIIKGKPGAVIVQNDAHQRVFSRVERPPTAGATLELTIDLYLQHLVERELQAGVERAGAAGGSAVVMNPLTGEILALANAPTFNPNVFKRFADDQRRNRAVQDLYEPGSTFKIITASAALEEKVVTPFTTIETSPGSIRFGQRVIDEDNGHNYGTLSFTDVIVKSSNVGSIKVGLLVGPKRMSAYVRRFGFGRPTSPDFRGESAGIVRPASQISNGTLASMSMGYEVGVTPLQMASAVSVVANGGELLEPRVVRAEIHDGRSRRVPRQVVNRAISSGVAAELTRIMEAVVTDGTGELAQVLGYTVAGKTGTTAKIVNRRYSTTDYNVSFVGFVPSRAPVFAIVVVVDTPRLLPAYGGRVAAPIFQRIASAALQYAGVPPTINRAPPLLVARRETPGAAPISGPAAPHGAPGITPPAASESSFPDLRGLSAREVLQVLGRRGLTPRLHGTGVVTAQQPAAGAPFEPGVEVTLWLERTKPADLPATAP